MATLKANLDLNRKSRGKEQEWVDVCTCIPSQDSNRSQEMTTFEACFMTAILFMYFYRSQCPLKFKFI